MAQLTVQRISGAGLAPVFGPFQENRFNDQNGNVAVSYSAAASVTVAAVELS